MHCTLALHQLTRNQMMGMLERKLVIIFFTNI